MMILFIALGCTSTKNSNLGKDSTEQSDTSASSEPSQEDTAAPPAIECTTKNSDQIQGITLEETDVSTVFKVNWTAIGDTHYLHYTDSMNIPRWILAESNGNTHHALTLGISEQQVVEAIPAVKIGEEVHCGPPQTVETQFLNPGLPEIDVSGTDQQGFLITGINTADTRYVVIINGKGDYVWAKEVPREGDLQTGDTLTQTLLTSNNTQITYFKYNNADVSVSTLEEVGFDGGDIKTIPVPGWRVSFTEVEEGVYAGLAIEERTLSNGDTVYGDIITELYPDGHTEEIWSVFDTFPTDQHDSQGLDDWAHTNYLTYDATRNKYLATVVRFHAALQVDRTSGQTDWMISGESNLPEAYSPSDPNDYPLLVKNPHSVQWLGSDKILVFNRSLGPMSGGITCSQATELQLNPVEKNVEISWTAESENCLWVSFWGNAIRLDNGNTMVMWSDKGQLDMFDQQGNIVWTLTIRGAQGIFGFGEWSDKFGNMQ